MNIADQCADQTDNLHVVIHKIRNHAEPGCAAFGSLFDIFRKSTLVGNEKTIHGDDFKVLASVMNGLLAASFIAGFGLLHVWDKPVCRKHQAPFLMRAIEKIDGRLSFTAGSVWKPEDRTCEPLQLPSPA
ncbi:hypothetical protein BJ166DRAFT_491607 [Pestalotiopsis sp. NC0098]|nr:hypothetical protein BJ166DRAFT_491607 [Pestalotiopsis sp. NC0098]